MKYGLIGEKLGHSFSKPLHEQLAGYTYEITEIAREDIDNFFASADFEAINVTIPYKEIALSHMDEVEPLAKEVGAVNTVVKRDGRLYGYNTDFFGMSSLIDKMRLDLRGKKTVILGTGGTAKTSLAVAKSLGASPIITVSRTRKNGAIDYTELYERHTDAERGLFRDLAFEEQHKSQRSEDYFRCNQYRAAGNAGMFERFKPGGEVQRQEEAAETAVHHVASVNLF